MRIKHINNIKKIVSNNFINVLKREDVRFRLITMLKLSFVVMLPFFLFALFIYAVLFNNLAYLNAIHFNDGDRLIMTSLFSYFDQISNYLVSIFLFFSCQMVISLYIAELILRPFRGISKYCLGVIDGDRKNSYDPFFYSDLKLLTSFSDFFFYNMESALENKKLEIYKIPVKFLKIHKPILEKGFFVHFLSWIFITVIINTYFINILGNEFFISLTKTYEHNANIMNNGYELFVNSYAANFHQVLWGIICIYIFFSIGLIFHFYGQVSTPAFAYFASMRSFLKGNHKARVHMLGYYFLRNDSRVFNKYLDFVCRQTKNEYHNKDT